MGNLGPKDAGKGKMWLERREGKPGLGFGVWGAQK